MLSATDTLVARLEERRDRARDSLQPGPVAVYSQAIDLVPDLFAGRGYGEAIAVATTTFQHELSQVHDELDRTAWQACIAELEQLYIDFS